MSASNGSPETNTNGSRLIEDWPQTSKPIKKSVTISDYSMLKKYVKDLDYQAIKAYKSEELKDFKAQAINEGVRIQALISSLPCEMGTAMKYLIEKGYLRRPPWSGYHSCPISRTTRATAKCNIWLDCSQ